MKSTQSAIPVPAIPAIMILAVAALVWVPAAASAICDNSDIRATALIMDAPTIDGDLSDWPGGLQVHNIGGTAPATFRVGYSPDADRIYVAIEVEDDMHVVGTNWANTDATDIYTWGGSAGKCKAKKGHELPVQFAMVPGPGEYNPGCGNPCAYAIATGKTQAGERGAQAAWHRSGNITTYEWSVPVFGDVRQAPQDLAPGRQVGFDIIVTDHDADPHYRWHARANPEGQKFLSPANVATLVLSGERATSPWDALAGAASIAGRLGLICVALLAVVVGGTTVRRKVRDRIGGGRVATLEQRVTDTQDVLIALSEKYDALEARYVELAKRVRRTEDGDSG